jgi:bis(5'-nucleosidyl)-tetraphosphatase
MKPRHLKHQKRPSKVVHEKSCGVILFSSQGEEFKYLLLHYPSGHWDFAKGHVENFDENEMATAQRELEEETGIKDIEFLPEYREEMYYEFNRGKKERVKKTVVYFLARSLEDDDVTISHEHKGFTWLLYQEALDRLTFENARSLLKKGQDHLK